MSLDLPDHEYAVSATVLNGDNLFVRFIGEYHGGVDTAALELVANKIENSSKVFAYLQRAKESNEYFYVFERGQFVVLSGESGDEIELKAESFQSKLDRPNVEEFEKFLARVQEAYGQEYKTSVSARAKLTTIQDLVGEQVRRLELKAASHEPGTTAAILYAQHIQFLQRIYDATKA
jgi:hypothetical protein